MNRFYNKYNFQVLTLSIDTSFFIGSGTLDAPRCLKIANSIKRLALKGLHTVRKKKFQSTLLAALPKLWVFIDLQITIFITIFIGLRIRHS